MGYVSSLSLNPPPPHFVSFLLSIVSAKPQLNKGSSNVVEDKTDHVRHSICCAINFMTSVKENPHYFSMNVHVLPYM